MDVGRRYPIDHLDRRVTQHGLSADIEELNDALLVGGDDREIGAVQDRVLQGPCFQQGLFASDLGDGFYRGTAVAESGE